MSVKDYWKYLVGHLKKSTTEADLEKAHLLILGSINTNSKAMILGAYLLIVNVLFEFKETARCIEVAKTMKAAGRWFEDPKFELLGYEFLGRCYSSLFQHGEAIDNFSKMLRIALGNKDAKSEFKAYDHLSKEFFYINAPASAMFFHRRMIDGEFEPDDSILRTLMLPEVNQRMGFKVFASSLASYKSVEKLNLDDLKVQANNRKEELEKLETKDESASKERAKAKTVYGRFSVLK